MKQRTICLTIQEFKRNNGVSLLMAGEAPAIDISAMPEVSRLAHEVARSG
jgi:hypothetical protein